MEPLLWILFYNAVLCKAVSRGIFLRAFADDLVALETDNDEESLMTKVNYALFQINEWVQEKGMHNAPAKMKAIIMVGRKNISFQIRKTEVVLKKS